MTLCICLTSSRQTKRLVWDQRMSADLHSHSRSFAIEILLLKYYVFNTWELKEGSEFWLTLKNCEEFCPVPTDWQCNNNEHFPFDLRNMISQSQFTQHSQGPLLVKCLVGVMMTPSHSDSLDTVVKVLVDSLMWKMISVIPNNESVEPADLGLIVIHNKLRLNVELAAFTDKWITEFKHPLCLFYIGFCPASSPKPKDS